MEEGLNKLLEKFHPDEVAMEELFFSKNITTGIAVAHARGVALLTCVKSCGRLYEYTPMQIKQALTRNIHRRYITYVSLGTSFQSW